MPDHEGALCGTACRRSPKLSYLEPLAEPTGGALIRQSFRQRHPQGFFNLRARVRAGSFNAFGNNQEDQPVGSILHRWKVFANAFAERRGEQQDLLIQTYAILELEDFIEFARSEE